MDFLEVYWTDVYKTGHKAMLPKGSELMFSNFTPRSGRLANFPGLSKFIIASGMQKTFRQLHEDWDNNFFNRDVSEIDQFASDMKEMLMLKEDFDVSHIKDLHSLGFLPIEVRAIEEGTKLPYKVPMFTIVNTVDIDGRVFDWIVNYLETILSAESWLTPTSATTAYQFLSRGRKGILQTDPENEWFLDFKYHDFSMRGMGGKSAIVNSGLGFAMVSKGSDTLPVIPATRKYYDATNVPINSVIATEHAISCTLTGFFLMKNDGSWDKIGELEIETFRYLLETFPTGILSLVSDTWDLWRVIGGYCVDLKDEILARDGKLVIRPDSGDPVDIMCGYNDEAVFEHINYNELNTSVPILGISSSNGYLGKVIYNTTDKYYNGRKLNDFEYMGVIESLYSIFGGTVSSTGFNKLNEKVGAIYGDSINIDRSERIDARMIAKGFTTTNYVLGVGSYSLQYVTRDTHGFAQKATYVEVEGNGIEIFKDPITDNGVKKSARGLIKVVKNHIGEYQILDQVTWDDVNSDDNQLRVIYRNGEFHNEITFEKIRSNIKDILNNEPIRETV